MKNIFLTILALAFTASAYSQIDRSIRPEPAPAKPLDFGEYELFELDNGIKVIVVENDKLPRVSFSMIIDHDPVQEGDKVGYISLAGQMLRQGTKNRPKNQLDEEIDFMGASLFTGPSNVYVSGLSKYTEKLVALMADVALNPAFPADEFEKLKKQSLSGIENAKDNPDALSQRLFNRSIYGTEHPYGELETEASINKASLEDVKAYYQKFWAPNHTYIAVVGDIKAKKAKKLLKKAFGKWPQKELPAIAHQEPAKPNTMVVNMINRSNSAQSSLKMGNTIQLKPGDNDIVKLELANQILGGGPIGRLFQNIREDKGYTYGAYSNYDEDRLIGEFSAYANVRNEVTDSALTEFLMEFKKLRTEPVPTEELQAAKNFIAGSFGRSLERPQTIASFALNVQRYGLPENYYENYLQRLDKLTAADVQEVAKKYIQTENMTVTVVGKASEVADKLDKFGPITYYNFQGEVVEPPSMPVPVGLTAKAVIDNYINAIGGADQIKKVEDISMNMSVSMAGLPPGTTISGKTLQKRPDYFMQEMNVAGMGTVSKQIFDGKTAKVNSMQGNQSFTEGEEFESMKKQATFFIEAKYPELGYTTELTAVEMVDGKKAYAVEVTSPSGEKSTEYYAVDSGFKIKETGTTPSPQGDVSVGASYSDYRKVNGVMFPHKIVVLQGPQKIEMNVTEMKVNSGLKKSDFQ